MTWSASSTLLKPASGLSSKPPTHRPAYRRTSVGTTVQDGGYEAIIPGATASAGRATAGGGKGSHPAESDIAAIADYPGSEARSPSRRERSTHAVVRGQVEHSLTAFVTHVRIGAPLDEHLDHLGVTELSCHHQCRAAPIIDSVNLCATVEKQIDDAIGSADTHAVLIPRSPHECCQIIAVAHLGVDARVEQPAHNLREAASGRISHPRLASHIRYIWICMARKQLLGDAIIAFEGRDRKRRSSGSPREIGVGAFRQ